MIHLESDLCPNFNLAAQSLTIWYGMFSERVGGGYSEQCTSSTFWTWLAWRRVASRSDGVLVEVLFCLIFRGRRRYLSRSMFAVFFGGDIGFCGLGTIDPMNASTFR